MMDKCEICGADAGYFTDTYDPIDEKRHVIPLCEVHEQIICGTILLRLHAMQFREAMH